MMPSNARGYLDYRRDVDHSWLVYFCCTVRLGSRISDQTTCARCRSHDESFATHLNALYAGGNPEVEVEDRKDS